MNKDSQDLRMSLPQKIRFNPFTRYFTMFMACLAMFYAIYVMTVRINSDSSALMKAIPFIIIFLALDSLLRNSFNLNTVFLTDDFIEFGFILKKNQRIKWESINKLEVVISKRRLIRYIYTDENGMDKILTTTLGFPHMLAILNVVAEKAVNAEFDDFLKSVLITK
ncbi:MAG: hypothetical protein P9L91_09280 [Candidatus Zophobacter franzmannii]|jgi:hypothetical protein|nr:hypothetical protein [Candidatus Zophobacter franzmannii]